MVLLYSDWALLPILGQFSYLCECIGLGNTFERLENTISTKKKKMKRKQSKQKEIMKGKMILVSLILVDKKLGKHIALFENLT